MVDTKTKNKSFILMWRHLQDNNIDNNSFMLELKDETLQNLELSSLNNMEEKEREVLIRKIIEECKSNIWFFFREIVHIGNSVGESIHFHDNDSRFTLTPITTLMIYLYNKGYKYMVLPPVSLFQQHYGVHTTLTLLSMYDYHFNNDKLMLLNIEKNAKIDFRSN